MCQQQHRMKRSYICCIFLSGNLEGQRKGFKQKRETFMKADETQLWTNEGFASDFQKSAFRISELDFDSSVSALHAACATHTTFTYI